MGTGQEWEILGLSEPGILSEDGLGLSLFPLPRNYASANNPSFWRCLLWSKKVSPRTHCGVPPTSVFLTVCHLGIGCTVDSTPASGICLGPSFMLKNFLGIRMQRLAMVSRFTASRRQVYPVLLGSLTCCSGPSCLPFSVRLWLCLLLSSRAWCRVSTCS